MRSDRERLEDVLESIGQLRRYARAGRETFEQDEPVRNSIIRHIEIIGEACGALSPELKRAHEEVPWAQITAMRNALIHAYFQVDLDAVWGAVERDVPKLEQQVRAITPSSPAETREVRFSPERPPPPRALGDPWEPAEASGLRSP